MIEKLKKIEKKKIIKVIPWILIVGVTFFVYFTQSKEAEILVITEDTLVDADLEIEKVESLEIEEEKKDIFVHVSGAVNNPGIVNAKEGSRVFEVITEAGGINHDGSDENLNLAKIVIDGEKIHVYTKSEIEKFNLSSDAGGISASTTFNNGKVNINTATSSQLETISGIGPSTAEKIIDYRTTNGKFSKIEDLKNISGIGDKTFESLKDYITI